MTEQAFAIPWHTERREEIARPFFDVHAQYDPKSNDYFIAYPGFTLRADTVRELFLLYLKQIHYGPEEKQTLTEHERKVLS